MKIDINKNDWDEFDKLPKKEKIKKKPKSDNKENDNYKKNRKRGDDLDVLFR